MKIRIYDTETDIDFKLNKKLPFLPTKGDLISVKVPKSVVKAVKKRITNPKHPTILNQVYDDIGREVMYEVDRIYWIFSDNIIRIEVSQA